MFKVYQGSIEVKNALISADGSAYFANPLQLHKLKNVRIEYERENTKTDS